MYASLVIQHCDIINVLKSFPLVIFQISYRTYELFLGSITCKRNSINSLIE